MLIPRLATVLKGCFPDAAIADDDASLQVGSFPEWDSLGHYNFMLSVEEHFNVRFSLEEMAELESLSDIAEALIAHGVVAR